MLATEPQNWKNVSNTTDYNRLLKCWMNGLSIGPSLVRERKTTRLIENTHTLYLFRTKFKLVSCVRQIMLKFYGDDSTWQFFNFADKTGRVWVRGWICMKVDKVKLENQLRIVFWHAKLTWSNYLSVENSYSLTIQKIMPPERHLVLHFSTRVRKHFTKFVAGVRRAQVSVCLGIC